MIRYFWEKPNIVERQQKEKSYFRIKNLNEETAEKKPLATEKREDNHPPKSIKTLPKVDGFRYIKLWFLKSTGQDWHNSIFKNRNTELTQKIFATTGEAQKECSLKGEYPQQSISSMFIND